MTAEIVVIFILWIIYQLWSAKINVLRHYSIYLFYFLSSFNNS